MNEQDLIKAIRALIAPPAWVPMTSVYSATRPGAFTPSLPAWRTSYNSDKGILLVEEDATPDSSSVTWRAVDMHPNLTWQEALLRAARLTVERECQADEIRQPIK